MLLIAGEKSPTPAPAPARHDIPDGPQLLWILSQPQSATVQDLTSPESIL